MAILSLAAFYAPDGIPEELFPQAAESHSLSRRAGVTRRNPARMPRVG